MRKYIPDTTGKHIVMQVFGFIFLYYKIKKNDSGPNGNKHFTTKKCLKFTLLGYRTQLSTVRCTQFDCTQKKIRFCIVLFLCDGGNRVD